MSNTNLLGMSNRCPAQSGLSSRWSDAASAKLWSLEGDRLCAAARRRTGLTDFGDPAIESRLAILAKSIQREADLHPLGRFLAWIHLRDLLRTRLLLEDTWKGYAGFETVPVRRPIFITGMPRTGSTFLHELLAQDPGNRAPLVWEVMSPLSGDARRQIRRTARSLWWFRQFAPEADAVHPIRARTPHECVAIHSYTLLSRAFTAIFRIPAYEAFLATVGLKPAYLWENRFLQYLQWRGPEKRWVLKAPDHMFALEELLQVFPDAIIIQTHRNPLSVLESSSHLTDVLQRVFARPQKRLEIGKREARVLADGLDRITRFREDHSALAQRFLDVHYDELVSDPLHTVRRLYRELDLPLTCTAVHRIGTLATSRSRYAARRSRPRLDDFGIDPGMKTRFASYRARLASVRFERGRA
jgi:hypothetical protein